MVGLAPGWDRDCLEEFEGRMTDQQRPFPCIFGVEAVLRGTLRYAFVHGAEQSEQLAEHLRVFTEQCKELGKRTSVVCFFEEWAEEKSHDAYFTHFWELLRETSELDPLPWPTEFSRSTSESSFEYCFNGQAMFVVVNTNLHQARRSRAFSRVAITFQPRFVFDDLGEGTKQGDEARRLIRTRVEEYDDTALTGHLGSFGSDENREWKQYYLDDGVEIPAIQKCPVHNF